LDLERLVIDRLCSFFANPGQILDAISGKVDEHVAHGQLIAGARRLAGGPPRRDRARLRQNRHLPTLDVATVRESAD
jgi:hypothetical protein